MTKNKIIICIFLCTLAVIILPIEIQAQSMPVLPYEQTCAAKDDTILSIPLGSGHYYCIRPNYCNDPSWC